MQEDSGQGQEQQTEQEALTARRLIESMLDLNGKVRTLAWYEEQAFRLALQQTKGRVEWAAMWLQVGRATVYRKIREYKIILPPDSELPPISDRALYVPDSVVAEWNERRAIEAARRKKKKKEAA